jgi:pimeloyl-ACP methyl ester carboxylesterase
VTPEPERRPVLEPGTPPASPVDAVALLMHGGRDKSHAPTTPNQLTVRRMRPFARNIEAERRDHGLAVWLLRYRMRGWNGDEMSTLPDARWALDQIRAQHGDVPVVLVGHSLGGRTALRIADDPSVRAVAALAPWLPDGEPVDQLVDRTIMIAHGTLDSTTSPRGSLEYARRARAVTERVCRVEVERERHAMLWRYRLWQPLTTNFVFGALGYAPMPPLVANALAGTSPDGEDPLKLRV